MSVKLTILEQMEQVAREHGKILAPLKEDLVLADCGLDSLGFAVLVARLERMSLVRPRQNPITGAIVVADVVLKSGGGSAASRAERRYSLIAPRSASAS